MKIFSFGEYVNNSSYKVLDERAVRANSGIMLMLGAFAAINGFILKNYIVVPYVSGILLFSFGISVFVNPKFSPIYFISRMIVWKQTPLYIGAVQKRFAWSLGFLLSAIIFGLSFKLLGDVTYFEPVCLLCLICIILLYLETAFGICVGCKLYRIAIKLKLLKKPKVNPNCMGDSCNI